MKILARITILLIAAALVALVLSSCSPKAYHYKNGDMKGVTFKKSIPSKAVKHAIIISFIVISPWYGAYQNGWRP